MRPYYIAIVGSGPSAFFAAASLLKAADTTEDLDMAVDMLEMLPTPWGLVRSGSRRITPRSSRSASNSKRRPRTPASASSAMWSSANTSSPASSPSATTP
ncbi:NADPH-ferredoxin reductase FprA [Mycobacterium tuberculosis variant africanum]|nr:NADPH-ferredoxin reductase FprA [Mycobacterium tuberculosis variant africanum]